jgi:hypothetical protein
LRAAKGVKPTHVGLERRIDGGVILLADLFKVMMVVWRKKGEKKDGRVQEIHKRLTATRQIYMLSIILQMGDVAFQRLRWDLRWAGTSKAAHYAVG